MMWSLGRLPGSVESPDVVESLSQHHGMTFAIGTQQEFFTVGAKKEHG